MSVSLEQTQMRALLGLLGAAIPPGVNRRGDILYPLLCGVFNLWPMADRRWLDKIRYANSLPGACVMEWRRRIVDGFAAEAAADSRGVFARESCSGALADARARLLVAEAKYGARIPAPSSDSDGSSSDDDDPAGFRARKVAATRRAKRVIAADVAARRRTVLEGADAARLFNAVRPSSAWLKSVRRGLMCDAAGLSVLALPCVGRAPSGAGRSLTTPRPTRRRATGGSVKLPWPARRRTWCHRSQ